jgi:hypothetical protein
MSSFTKLLSRLSSLHEAKDSPMDRIMPGFQNQARSLAKSRGASSGTREGRLAMLGILFDLDIIDDSVVRMFKNDPSVSRMVEYFESNGIASKIKSKRDEIQAHIKDQLENKVSFTTGNRTDAAQQRYEVNKLNAELKAAKKVARLERKKETASAMSSMSQTVNMYDDLIGSLESSYSNEYMLEIIADRDSDLSDITQIVRYLSKFVDEGDIEVEGRSIDVVFGVSSKLGKIISRLGVEKIERQIADDLKSFGGAGVVIHEPDMNQKDMIGNLKSTSIEDEEYPTEEAEDESTTNDPYLQRLIGFVKKYQDEPRPVKIVRGNESLTTEKFDMESAKRVGRGLAGAAALVGTAVGGSHLAPKAYQAGKEIAGDIASRGGTDEFLARIKNDEDRERVQNELQALRDEGTAARLSGKSDRVTRMRDEFRKTEQEMRQTYKIPDTIQIQENVNITTAIYLTEQTKSDSARRSQPQQNLSFKDKYKPKTSFQLEELRRYGL